MKGFELSFKERSVLEDLLAQPIGARQFKRALALLLLDDGATVAEVGEELRVSRRTIYNWVSSFEDRYGLGPAARLLDAPRSGRPATAQGVIDAFIDQVIDRDPRELGYSSTVWTASLLCQHLRVAHHVDVSLRSIGLALARLRLRWKLPRYVLARRDPFWRQSKGGSNTASGRGSAPSSSCSTRRSSPKPRHSMQPMAESANRRACPLPGAGPSASFMGR